MLASPSRSRINRPPFPNVSRRPCTLDFARPSSLLSSFPVTFIWWLSRQGSDPRLLPRGTWLRLLRPQLHSNSVPFLSAASRPSLTPEFRATIGHSHNSPFPRLFQSSTRIRLDINPKPTSTRRAKYTLEEFDRPRTPSVVDDAGEEE